MFHIHKIKNCHILLEHYIIYHFLNILPKRNDDATLIEDNDIDKVKKGKNLE